MFKKICIAVSVLLICIIVAGCNGQENTDISEPNESEPVEEEKEEIEPIDFSVDKAGLDPLEFDDRFVLGPFKGGVPSYYVAPDQETMALWGWSDKERIWIVNPKLELVNSVLEGEGENGESHLNLQVGGWVDEKKLIAAATGEHLSGERASRLGTAIYLIQWDGSKRELAWVEGGTRLKQFYLTEDRAAAVLHIDQSVYLYDFQQEELVVVKEDLPSYDGLFNVKQSPEGWHLVYQRYESDSQGIYLLDLKEKKETALAVDNRYNFYPVWSSDSEHIAFLSSVRVDGGFDVIMGESGPVPLGSGIRIAHIDGDLRAEFQMENKVGMPLWSSDGSRLTFLEGVPEASGFYFEPEIQWKAIGLWEQGRTEAERVSALDTEDHVEMFGFCDDTDKILYRVVFDKGYQLWSVSVAEQSSDLVVEASGWDDSTALLGSELYYVKNEESKDEVYSVSLENGTERRITHTGGWKTGLGTTDEKLIFVRGENDPPYHYFLEIISH